MDKEKKKIILIVMGVILVSVGVGFGTAIIAKQNANKEMTNLRNILNDSLEISAVVNEDKTVELVSWDGKDEISKVEVWVFSSPVYLGEVNVVEKDNKYYLEGLNDILKDKSLELGSHRLLVMQDGKALGYIKIEITEDKSLKVTATSELVNDNAGNVGADENVGEEENNTTDKSSEATTDIKKEPAKTNNNKKPNSAENKQEEVKQPAVSTPAEPKQEEPKPEEVKCTPKKFKNKYTYFYEDKDTCVKNGDHQEAWDYFKANGISAYTYGCEEIKDECGNTYYGVYYGNMEGEKYYY